MMQIMHLRLPHQEIIPTMHRRRPKQLVPQKRPERQNMASQDLRGEGYREDIREDLLNGMCVLCGKRDWSSEAVVLLVDADVKVWSVEEAVAVVKEGFAEEEADDEVADEFEEGWEGGFDSIG